MFKFLAKSTHQSGTLGCRREFPRHLLHRITTLAISACTALFAQTLYTPSLKAESSDRPNIVLILADDMGYRDLSCYGSDFYRSPNIDKLANHGIRFTNAYSACSVCSPTRASIMTGKYPARLHLTDWIPGHKRPKEKLQVPDWQKGLPEGETTFADLLRKRGYTTAWFGKWHLGGECEEFGFDAGEQDWSLNKKKDENDPKGVFTLTDQAIEFIDQAGDKPFFIGLSHYAVHTPIRYNKDVKAKYEARINPGAHQQNAEYAAMVEALDDSVGRLLDALEKTGKAENTVVVFHSDNGGLLRQTSNAPLRGGKGMLYEGGSRVPFIVRLPNGFRAGEVNDAMVCSIDLLPTFVELAGGLKTPDDIDGISLVPLLTGKSPLRRDTLYWHYPHYHKGLPGGSIRKGPYKLIEFFEDGKIELYNLDTDLSESENLAKKMPEKAAELLADLKAWRKELDAQMMTPNPNYSGE